MESMLTGLGLSGSAGLNAYLPLLILGLSGRMGWITLNEPYDMLATYPVLAILGVLLLIEMTADKVPAVDTINDGIQTFIRPTAGALLVASSTGAFTGNDPVYMDILTLLGGTVSAGAVHVVKAMIRPGVTVTTGGMGNMFVSALEDIISLCVSLIAILLPFIVIFFTLSLVTLFGWWQWDTQRVRRYFGENAVPRLVYGK